MVRMKMVPKVFVSLVLAIASLVFQGSLVWSQDSGQNGSQRSEQQQAAPAKSDAGVKAGADAIGKDPLKKDPSERQAVDGNLIAKPDADPVVLNDEDKRLAKLLVSAYRMGDWNRVVGVVRQQLADKSVDDVASLARRIKDTDRLALPQLVWEARLRLSRVGSQLPKPNAIETLLIAKQFSVTVAKEIAALRSLDLMATPLEDPEDLDAYRDLVWEHHVHSNEVQNVLLVAKQGAWVKQSLKREDTPANKAARLEMEDFDFLDAQEQLVQLKRDMDERVLEVRVNRVRHAVRVLQDQTAWTDKRFKAAYVIGVDSDSLLKAISDPRAFEREALQDPNLAEQIAESLEQGKAAAGDLVKKSRLLFAGLHWWRRGRYGVGTDFFGLLKSKNAIRDPRLQNALMMPRSAPVPTDPNVEGRRSVPAYQRRHLFIWGYEDRRFTTTSSSGARSSSRGFSKLDELENKHFDGFINGEFW